MILTYTEMIGWVRRWYSETGEDIDFSTIENWKNSLEYKLMSGCCPDDGEAIYRFTEDGTYEKSTDGGETWEPAPLEDPRRDVVQAPPLSGVASNAKRCAAADNVRDQYKQMRDNTIELLTAGTTLLLIIAALVGAIGGFFASTVVGAAIAPMLFGLAGILLSLTPESVEEQIDDTALEQFKCYVFCAMDTNGRIEDFPGLLSDIADNFTGFPETFFYTITASLGEVGLNNMATAGTATADDCDDCECSPGVWCYEYNFTAEDGDWDVLYGAWTSGIGWQGTAAGSGVSIVIYKSGLTFNVTHIEVDVVCAGTCNIAVIIDDSVGIAVANDAPTGSYSWGGDYSGGKFTLNPSSGGTQGADVTMTRILFSGVGDNPFGSDNC